MRILVLGGTGMLGHELVRQLSHDFDVFTTIRANAATFERYGLAQPQRIIPGVDAMVFDSVIKAFALTQPDVVINAIGVIKQLDAAKDPITTLSLNALFPHQLAQLCMAAKMRLVHISTDCVFSGAKGMYVESDVPDPVDLYGHTKQLGEVNVDGCITLRTSIIGRELNSAFGLVEWFLRNRGGTVTGFRGAVYSGFTTIEMARIIRRVLVDFPMLSGIYNVSSEPINKYALLNILNQAFNAGIDIRPVDEPTIDRSLDSQRFRAATAYAPPSWREMVDELAALSN